MKNKNAFKYNYKILFFTLFLCLSTVCICTTKFFYLSAEKIIKNDKEKYNFS